MSGKKEEKGKFHSLFRRRQMTRKKQCNDSGEEASFSLDKSGDDDEGGRGGLLPSGDN